MGWFRVQLNRDVTACSTDVLGANLDGAQPDQGDMVRHRQVTGQVQRAWTGSKPATTLTIGWVMVTS